ncbi:DUF397 domain-containing protein [Streptomyces chrestomyceticus]|uniref:DUF397 domain-containing protein n=1 Tax=Streptomyces chrestomyceticus TaxID=68185 RepID=UPI0034027227
MPAKPNWRTSSYTKSDSCVEVADNQPNVILVRDSKNREGGMLTFRPASWLAFLELSKRHGV